ncbi:MAG: ribonuclease P protein component [Bacteroidales bacterium]
MEDSVLSFPKEERLHVSRLIELLFTKGKSFHYYPLKATWILLPDVMASPVQILITVPKKNFKHAVYRNLLKRRIKEAYRLNKSALLNSVKKHDRHLLLALIYTAPNALPFQDIQEKINLILQRLIVENEKNSG